MVGDLFSAFVLTRTISEDKISGQRPFSAFVLTRTISEGPLAPRGDSPAYQTGSPKDLGTKILVPRSWYQDPWYQDLGADGLIKKSFFVGPLEFTKVIQAHPQGPPYSRKWESSRLDCMVSSKAGEPLSIQSEQLLIRLLHYLLIIFLVVVNSLVSKCHVFGMYLQR